MQAGGVYKEWGTGMRRVCSADLPGSRRPRGGVLNGVAAMWYAASAAALLRDTLTKASTSSRSPLDRLPVERLPAAQTDCV